MTRVALSIVIAFAFAWLGCRAAGPDAEATPAPAPAPSLVSSPPPSSSPGPTREPAAAPERSLGVVDRGVFADLDAAIQIPLPRDASPERARASIDREHAVLTLYLDGRALKVYPLGGPRTLAIGEHELALRPGDHAELAPLLREPEQLRVLAAGQTAPPGDRDADGIPDPIDLWIGIRKVELDAATYDDGYHEIDYPGGDVPRDRGACVDVIVRALRNAGVDLQVELHEDIRAHPRRYPMVERPNAAIDHRRVRTVLPYFRAHWQTRPSEPDEAAPWQAGEVVFMETMASRSGSDHIGWVFEPDPTIDPERPLVVNAWTEGYSTEAMDLLAWVPVTDRFALPPTPEHAGPISAWTSQLVLVVAEDASSFRARARRFARAELGGAWQAEGEPFDVVLGHAGLAWGRGRHGEGPPPGLLGPIKREGDGRSPAGVFELGALYGRATTPSFALALPYHSIAADLRCVDDPRSTHYGSIVGRDAVEPDWASAEDMPALYEYALVVEHNGAHEPGSGSCIFVHAWRDADTPVTGCTAMAEDTLTELLAWLEPGALLVVLPAPAHRQLARAWSLPNL